MPNKTNNTIARRNFLIAGTAAAALPLFFDSARSQSPVQWKLNGDQSVGFWWNEELEAFAKSIGTATSGKMKVDFYPGSSLGVAPPNILAPVRAGTIEMAEFVGSYVAGEAAYLTVAGLPMLSSSTAHARRITQAVRPDFEKELAGKYDLILLATLISTPLQLYLGKKPYKDVTSLKGLRIRTLGPDQEAFIRSFGGTPVEVPIADLVSSIATNRIDGAISGTQYFLSQKFSQFGPNLLAWDAIVGPGFLVVGKTKWSTLSPDLQQAVMTSAKQFEDHLWERAATLEGQAQRQATAEGFAILPLSDPDKKTLTEGAQTSWSAWAQRGGPLASHALEVARATK